MKTEIIAVVDASTSMQRLAREAVQGFDDFIAEQRKLAGEARLSLYTFNSQVTCHYAGRHLASVEPLSRSYVARGNTALHDAIGDALTNEYKRTQRERWADKVIVAILTDGEENSSRRFNQYTVRELISQRQNQDWEFVFLAANQDAFATARNYGIREDYVANFAYSGQGATQAMQTLSAATTAIRGTTY